MLFLKEIFFRWKVSIKKKFLRFKAFENDFFVNLETNNNTIIYKCIYFLINLYAEKN